MNRNLYELKKTHWNDLGGGLIRSKNGKHAIYFDGTNYHEWNFDLLPGETVEQNTLKTRDYEKEFGEWKNATVVAKENA